MDSNEPQEKGSAPEGPAAGKPAAQPGTGGGWTQFGQEPPRAGGFVRPDHAAPDAPGGAVETGPAGPSQGSVGEDSPTQQIHPVPPYAQGGAGGAAPQGEAPHLAPGGPGSYTQVLPLPPAPAAKRGFSTGQKALAGLALAAVALGGGVAGAFTATAISGDRTVVTGSTTPLSPAANTMSVADVARDVQPSVVSIKTGNGEGSGVVLSAEGLILTNNHVVATAGSDAQITVKFSDGRSATATVKGTDPSTDLAVLQVADTSGLSPAKLGDSDRLKVGDAVLAIGSPLGLEGSVTAGIVSALDRTITVGGERRQELPPGWGGMSQGGGTTTIGGAIQTDAAINPGNSGGALVDRQGQVIGINTAIATGGVGSGNIGVGFAIPINTAKRVAEQLATGGKVSHAFLGVSLTDASGDTAGALIREVQQGSPAEQSGLREGDLIIKLGDRAVDGADTVVGAVRGFRPGDKVEVSYVRDGRPATTTVTLAEAAGQ
jgi:putative serine protease PepD